MTLTTNQKILIGFGDFIAGLGGVVAFERFVRKDTPGMMAGSIAIFAGTIFALVAMFKSKPKPSNLIVITNIVYACVGFLISMAGAFEHSLIITAGGVVVQLIALIGMNIAVFKQGDVKVFNIINIICIAVGASLVLAGQMDTAIKHKEIVTVLGVAIVGLAATGTNLALYKHV